MKKIGLWKKLASWLLVFLLVLQIPTEVFAEDWISENDISISVDSVENEEADYNEEEENTDFYSDENIEESEGDSFTDSEELPEADIASFSDETSLSEDTETQEIQVTVRGRFGDAFGLSRGTGRVAAGEPHAGRSADRLLPPLAGVPQGRGPSRLNPAPKKNTDPPLPQIGAAGADPQNGKAGRKPPAAFTASESRSRRSRR